MHAVLRSNRSRALVAGAIVLVCAAGVALASAAGIRVSLALTLLQCAHAEADLRRTCYERVIPAAYPEHDASALFSLIAALQKADVAAEDCHFIAHEIGRAVALEHKDRWEEHLLPDGSESLCSFGYIHGLAIAVYGEAMSPESLSDELPRLSHACAGEGLGTLARRGCYHGAGHMLYRLTGAEIRPALEACDAIDLDDEDGELFRRVCYTGVTMELFYAPEGDNPDPRGLTPETAPAFCATLGSGTYERACLRASWILRADEFAAGGDIAGFCGDPSAVDAEHCYAKVFNGLAWILIDEPERMLAVCARMPEAVALSCYTHAATEHLVSGGGKRALGAALALCDAAHAAFAAPCREYVALYGRFLYPQGAAREEYCSRFSDVLARECIAAPYE